MRGFLAPFGFFLMLLHVSLSGRSLLLTLGLVGAVLLLGIGERSLSWRQVFGIFTSPYLPFVTVALVIAPFQEKATDAFWLLSIPVSYVLARLFRFVVPTNQLALGIGLLGFVLGAVFVVGRSQVGQAFPPLEDLAAYLHKNVFGWIVAFGLVMALFLWAYYADRVTWQAALGGLSGATGVLLFFTGSMTGFLGAGAALAGVSLVSLLRPVHDTKMLSGRWWQFAPLGVGGLMLLGFVIANLWSGSEGSATALAERDATLTGRTSLWACYLEGLFEVGSDEDAIRWECVGSVHSNLHNSFLEAYSIGGVLLAVALGFGFAAAIVQSARVLWRSSDPESRNEALFALAIAVLGFLIAMVESYIFSRHVYPSLIVFLGPILLQGVPGLEKWRTGRVLFGGLWRK